MPIRYIRSMTLAEYLKVAKLTRAAFAAQIGATQVAVSRYITGRRIPHPNVMVRIKQATGGAVTADDFHDQRGAAA
jgi:predicted transcriptional regulator